MTTLQVLRQQLDMLQHQVDQLQMAREQKEQGQQQAQATIAASNNPAAVTGDACADASATSSSTQAVALTAAGAASQIPPGNVQAGTVDKGKAPADSSARPPVSPAADGGVNAE